MRGAASRELLEDYATCERDYEAALWLLYAIYDDIMQEGNPYKDQDRVTIGRCEWLVFYLNVVTNV